MQEFLSAVKFAEDYICGVQFITDCAGMERHLKSSFEDV